MALQQTLRLHPLFSPIKEISMMFPLSLSSTTPLTRYNRSSTKVSFLKMNCPGLSSQYFSKSALLQVGSFRRNRLRASKMEEELKSDDGKNERGKNSNASNEEDDPFLMDEEERQEWRRKIREVIAMNPDVEEEVDPIKHREKMQKLLADYPLIVEEDDPDWPEDAEGHGFSLDQFFNKITIKNKKKDDDDDDDYNSEDEIIWQDDDYIRPIKDIRSMEWEVAVFKDISPLVVLVHNRYKRPKENEQIRNELEKAVHIIWNCRLPSPRCVAVDAVVEPDLVSALEVSRFPQLIFTKAGKILYREKATRTADELSKIMAFFYYGAAKPPCLNIAGNNEEEIPTITTSDR